MNNNINFNLPHNTESYVEHHYRQSSQLFKPIYITTLTRLINDKTLDILIKSSEKPAIIKIKNNNQTKIYNNLLNKVFNKLTEDFTNNQNNVTIEDLELFSDIEIENKLNQLTVNEEFGEQLNVLQTLLDRFVILLEEALREETVENEPEENYQASTQVEDKSNKKYLREIHRLIADEIEGEDREVVSFLKNIFIPGIKVNFLILQRMYNEIYRKNQREKKKDEELDDKRRTEIKEHESRQEIKKEQIKHQTRKLEGVKRQSKKG